MVLVACLAGVTAVAMQVRCVDAAREAARLGARVDLRRDGDLLVATVVAHSKLLPALDIRAQAVSAAEPAR